MQQKLDGSESGWWMLSEGDSLWLPQSQIPYGRAKQFGLAGCIGMPIGTWENDVVWLVQELKPDDMVSVRQLLTEETGLFYLAGRAVQLAFFYRSHQFCGFCGHKMYPSLHEWCCLCHHCKQRYYPQIAPSIIVVIRREDHLLLAQHTRHRGGMYTALAGFVEVGETAENAVSREVFEETKINITNVRYIASQPWPFPHSLMMAYLADYAGGDIQIDQHELIDAQWYYHAKLPTELPPSGTIARRLIEDTVYLCRNIR